MRQRQQPRPNYQAIQATLDATKISWRTLSHTNASQLCVGVCPPGTARDEIEKQVKGTFGGRFEQFTGSAFVYVAYTD